DPQGSVSSNLTVSATLVASPVKLTGQLTHIDPFHRSPEIRMPLTRRALAPLAAALLFSGTALAGPNDPSKFDGTRYLPQKALYEFNFSKPLEGKAAFGYVKNHLRAIEGYGDPKSHTVIVAHGNELHAFSRLNRAAYPDMYEELKAL